jgi:ribonuclease P protein component
MPRSGRAGVSRITDSQDIRSLKRTGRFFRGRFVLIWFSHKDSDEAEEPVVGVVAGKGFGRAVDRNLAKRRVRGCILGMKRLLEPGNRYLVECRPGAETADYQYLVIEIERALSRSK